MKKNLRDVFNSYNSDQVIPDEDVVVENEEVNEEGLDELDFDASEFLVTDEEENEEIEVKEEVEIKEEVKVEEKKPVRKSFFEVEVKVSNDEERDRKREEFKEELKNMEDEIMRENVNVEAKNNTKGNVVREILEKDFTYTYEILIPYQEVLDYVKNEINRERNVSLFVADMPWDVFRNKYIRDNMNISQEMKMKLGKPYYPSSIIRGKGEGVSHLLVVTVDKESLVNKKESKSFGFSSEGASIKQFVNRYPQLFGSRNFVPSEEVSYNNNEYYNIFLSTYHVILSFLGLDTNVNRLYSISIIDSEIQGGDRTKGPTQFYSVRFRRK